MNNCRKNIQLTTFKHSGALQIKINKPPEAGHAQDISMETMIIIGGG